MNRYSGLVAALIIGCFALAPLASSRAQDTRSAKVPKIIPKEEAMKKYHKTYIYKVYPGAQHGFYNETTADRFHPEAAKEAWNKTLELFAKKLKG